MSCSFIVDKDFGVLPKRSTVKSAGYDLYSPVETIIGPGETTVINTGVSVKMPDDFVFLLQSRSGMAIKGVTTEAGVVDADYFPNYIGVVLRNFSKEPYLIKKNDRISQGIILKYQTVENEDFPTTQRTGGFGSTN